MRTIKFRGKSKEDKEFVYGYYFKTEDKHYILQQMLGGLQKFEVIPESVGQFTGFYDKNGKEIYEGDILKPLNEHFTYVVKFGNGCFYIEYILGKWNTLERGIEVYKNFDRDIEIIGNIHENTELLK